MKLHGKVVENNLLFFIEDFGKPGFIQLKRAVADFEFIEWQITDDFEMFKASGDCLSSFRSRNFDQIDFPVIKNNRTRQLESGNQSAVYLAFGQKLGETLDLFFDRNVLLFSGSPKAKTIYVPMRFETKISCFKLGKNSIQKDLGLISKGNFAQDCFIHRSAHRNRRPYQQGISILALDFGLKWLSFLCANKRIFPCDLSS